MRSGAEHGMLEDGNASATGYGMAANSLTLRQQPPRLAKLGRAVHAESFVDDSLEVGQFEGALDGDMFFFLERGTDLGFELLADGRMGEYEVDGA